MTRKMAQNSLQAAQRYRRRVIAFALLTALAGAAFAVLVLWNRALAAEYQPADPINLPAWVWPTLFMGAVQGLVVFGAFKVKFDWLFHRLAALEKELRDHVKELNGRIDRVLENRRRTDHE